MSVRAIDRELRVLRDRAGGPRPPLLGCVTVAHDRLGYCGGCVPSRPDGGANGQGLEVLGWRLLALRDVEPGTATCPHLYRYFTEDGSDTTRCTRCGAETTEAEEMGS